MHLLARPARNQDREPGLECLGSFGADEPSGFLRAHLESHLEFLGNSPHLTLLPISTARETATSSSLLHGEKREADRTALQTGFISDWWTSWTSRVVMGASGGWEIPWYGPSEPKNIMIGTAEWFHCGGSLRKPSLPLRHPQI